MLRRGLMIVVVLVALAALATTSLAQQAPDLSGTWKLNLDKSDFGQMPRPIAGTDVIEQHGVIIKHSVESESQYGKREFVLTFSTDGKETKYAPDSGPIVGRATLLSISSAWQGGNLVVKMVLDYQGNNADETDTYSLSQDGQVLTVSSDIKNAMGERTRKMVFDRVSDSAAASSSASASGSAAAPAITTSPVATPAVAAAPAPPDTPAAPTSAPSAATTTSPETPSSPAATSSSPTAQATPNLTGTWKLNLSKSNFGQIPPPESQIDKIVDNEPSLVVDASQKGGPMGDVSIVMDITTDGKESSSTMMGHEVKRKAHWEGSSLVVVSTMQGQSGEAKFTSTYTLDAEGKTLTVATHVSGPQGEMDVKSVFDKQP
jgi:hypothetical protein